MSTWSTDPANPTDREPRKRIGVYRRVSTVKQLDNERFESSLEDMTEYVQRFGYDVVPYDEGARSGAHLSNRKVASQMLADLKKGVIDGIAAPDVSRFTRGEWMEDGRQIAKALLSVRGLLITRDGFLDLRRPRDLERYQEELVHAARERRRIARRFWEGHYDRARKAADGVPGEPPFARHRTMLGYRLEILMDEHGQPRITRRGQVKKKLAKNPERKRDMAMLIDALNVCHTTAELYASLRRSGVKGPSTATPDGWVSRDLRCLLRSPLHRGVWHFVRTMGEEATVWFGLDPRQDEFDPSQVMREVPELAYWTAAQADAWERKFFVSHRPSRGRTAFDHPLLGLLRCPGCHELMLGKGKFGYICPGYNKRICEAPVIVRESTAQTILLQLLPEMQAQLNDLRDETRAWLRERNDGGLEVQMEALANRERRLLDLYEASTDPPETFKERLAAIARERKQLLDQQAKAEQVGEARLEAERALAGFGDDSLEFLLELDPSVRAVLYAAFYEAVEVRPAGPGRIGGRIVSRTIHNQRDAGIEQLMDLLGGLTGAAA